MNIEHKKTTLDDDAILYQKRDDSFARKDLSGFSRAEKLTYFKDYYLKKLLIGAVFLIAAIYFIYSLTFARKESVFSAVFLNQSYISDLDGINAALTDYLIDDSKNQYVGASNFDLDQYQEQMAYITQMSTGTIDLVVCPKDYFKDGSAQGLFMDLEEFLPSDLYETLKERMLTASEAVTDEAGEVTSYLDPKEYGISLSGTTRYSEFDGYDPDSVLCVLRNTPNPENAVKVIAWFTDVPFPAASAPEE